MQMKTLHMRVLRHFSKITYKKTAENLPGLRKEAAAFQLFNRESDSLFLQFPDFLYLVFADFIGFGQVIRGTLVLFKS